MKQHDFILVASYAFLLIALVHLIRAVAGWDIRIHFGVLPLWASWVIVVVSGYLAFTGFKYRSPKNGKKGKK